MTELWRLPATQLALLVRRREVSAREAANSALERLEVVNPRINAVVECRPEVVRTQADRIDQMLARGGDPGPLAGVPVTVKINIDQAGFATTNGTRLQKDFVARENSPAVDNLVRAGAVLLGRSNAPTFALRWFTSNLLYGRTRNPRDPSLTPGGSSGGGAAAVAAGIGPLALGTDIGGSIRYPAYACGIHGLRPSLGRVPAYNGSSPERPIGAQMMSVTGPIARTVEDLSVALRALSAPDPRDPWWAPAPVEGPSVPLRAAVCPNPRDWSVAADVKAAVVEAGRRLSDAGWHIEEIDDMPSLLDAAEVQKDLWLGDGFATLANAAMQDGDPAALAIVEAVREKVEKLPADVVARSLVRRTTLSRQWRLFLDKHPVLLLPVSSELPFPDDADLQGPAGFDRVWQAQLALRALPAIGLPGLTVSTGLVGSAPVGVQIVAGPYREDLCLRAGTAIEARGTPSSPIDPV